MLRDKGSFSIHQNNLAWAEMFKAIIDVDLAWTKGLQVYKCERTMLFLKRKGKWGCKSCKKKSVK